MRLSCTQSRISTHAPRAGSDLLRPQRPAFAGYFNPRSPCGERPAEAAKTGLRRIFQPTLPVRGATAALKRLNAVSDISTHAPRVGSDWHPGRSARPGFHFNPRSPCGERHMHAALDYASEIFQPTLPVWGATTVGAAPRLVHGDFNPRSPCGERLRRQATPLSTQ